MRDLLVYYLDLARRSLKRNKVLTALMVLAIALGIGACMTTLTVFYILSGDPIPTKSAKLFYARVDAMPGFRDEPGEVIDYRTAVDLWRAKKADRQTIFAASGIKASFPDSGLPARMVSMLATTDDFFGMFDVPFQYGGPWSAEDGEKRVRVAVISANLNDRVFGGANSVGRSLRLRSTTVKVVGVLKPWRPSPQFYMVAFGRSSEGKTDGFYGSTQDVFVPFESGLDLTRNFNVFACWQKPEGSDPRTAPCLWVYLWVELGNPEKAEAYRQFLANYAAEQKGVGRFATSRTRLHSLVQWLDYNRVVPSNVRLQVWIAFSFLAVCLCNTTGLMLAKFLRRSGEIGVRRALGASRSAIFSQYLVEAGMVGMLGAAGGLVLTLAGLWLVRGQPNAYADLARLDLPMFMATFALSIATSLLAGALPAYRASQVAPALQLKAL